MDTTNSVDETMQDRPISPVERALADNEKALSELNELVGVLKSRLMSVTSSHPSVIREEAKSLSDAQPSLGSSQVVNGIGHQGVLIARARLGLDDILETLEV